ncbi:4905_t:CDS:2, partial [Funneliformis geosporum]
MGMQSIQVLFNTSEVIYVLIFIGSIFTIIWHILRVARHQLVNDADKRDTMIALVTQNHLELILNKKFRDINFKDINFNLENIGATTDAISEQLYDMKTDLDKKNTQKYDEIKTYLTKKFNEVNAENHENMLALYDKLLEIEGRVWTVNNEQYDNFIANVARFSEQLNRHTRSNDEILTIREKLDHLEEYLRILAPHILNITPVSGSNDSSSFTSSSEEDNLDDIFISQDLNL